VLEQRGDRPGPVHILSAMEACDAYKPGHDKQTHRTFIRPYSGKSLHDYFYFRISLTNRLVYNVEIIAIEGECYRLNEARERTVQRAPPAPRWQIMSPRPTPPAAAVLNPSTQTPEQALAVFELRYGLRDRVWPSTAVRSGICYKRDGGACGSRP
jgi:hypothetical protein